MSLFSEFFAPDKSGKMVYDTLVNPSNNYPTSGNYLFSANTRYCHSIVNEFEKYSNCRWELNNHTTGVITNELSFDSLDDIATYWNQNIPNNGSKFTQEVTFRPYDVVDYEIPVIDKLYGVNRLYSGFKGKFNNKSGAPNCMHMSNNWSAGRDILIEMFNQQFPGLSGLLESSDFEGSDSVARRMFWLSSTYKNQYGLPKPGTEIYLDSSSIALERAIANENWEGPQVMTEVHTPSTYTLQNPLCLIFKGDKTGEVNSYSINQSHWVARELCAVNDTSGLIFYRAINTTQAEGDRNFGIYIKPLGIDTVYINYVDTTKYDVEAVFFNRERQKCIINNVTSLLFNSNQRIDVSGLPKGAWIVPSGFTGGKGWNRAFQTYFRLRSKESGRVSALSRSRIVPFLGHGLAAVKWMVV